MNAPQEHPSADLFDRAVAELLTDFDDRSVPPGVNERLLTRLQTANAPLGQAPRARKRRLATLVVCGVAATILVSALTLTWLVPPAGQSGWLTTLPLADSDFVNWVTQNLGAFGQSGGVRDISPSIAFPNDSIRDFANLQQVRSAGRQNEIRFIELQWMPEFMDDHARDTSRHAIDFQHSRLEFLNEFPRLEGLRLDHLFLTEADLRLIGQLPSLRQLSLSGVQVLEEPSGKHRLRGEELKHLAPLVTLEALDLSQADFAGGMQHLSGLPELRLLLLKSFEHLNDASLADLAALSNLETLVIAPVYSDAENANPQRVVTDAGLASLQRIPKLKKLFIGYHGDWTAPVDKLRELLPGVDVQPGFVVPAGNARPKPTKAPLPVKIEVNSPAQ